MKAHMVDVAELRRLLGEATVTPHQERLELAAQTMEAFTGDPRNNRARDIREGAGVLAALLAAAPELIEAAERAERQTAWMIERSASDNDVAKYWNPGPGWMIDPNKGLRLCRREDAEAYRLSMRFGHMSTVSEHVFLDQAALAPPAQGEG